MQINRSYDHKRFGHVGDVVLEVEPDGESVRVLLNDILVPESTMRHLFTFALQSFQDAYAGADDADEARANFDKKLAKAIAGEIGTKTGTGIDRMHALRRIVARELCRDMMSGGEYKTKLGKTVVAAEVDATLDWYSDESDWSEFIHEEAQERHGTEQRKSARMTVLKSMKLGDADES